jgi:signal transduction histidine kinase
MPHIADRAEFAPPTRLAPPQREQLLAASARVSRVLLEAPDVMLAMPAVLREIGKAAAVDRTALAIVEMDEAGARWIVIKSEWIAPDTAGDRSLQQRIPWDEVSSLCPGERLRSGKTVQIHQNEADERRLGCLACCSARSSVLVPFLVDGEFVGVIGLDDCHTERHFEADVVSALEIAASVIGAALHRDRLTAAVHTERELAAAQRIAELARANAALRANLEWLASSSTPQDFFGQMLLETIRQFDAAAGTLFVLEGANEQWRIMTHAVGGEIRDAPFDALIPAAMSAFSEIDRQSRQPTHMTIEHLDRLAWPGMQDFHMRQGHSGSYLLPLVFDEHMVGFLVLAFSGREPLSREQEQWLFVMGQQMTFAIAFRRLSIAARHAAVLSERNRISQEIHDGLAQAFVGILMQLSAAEGCPGEGPLAAILVRIRDLAREGLAEARRSVLALQPGEPRAGGLALALRQLAERSTIIGRLQCDFEGAWPPGRVAPEQEHELLRIAQEAVSNAVRHAQPRRVQIALSVAADHLQLSVTDDGRGMHELPEIYAQQGFGLTNMRERAQAIGGEWQLYSRPGEGTRITVRVPKDVRP